MRLHRLMAVAVASVALILAPVAAASATDPVTLGADYVLDDAGALNTAQRGDAEHTAQRFADDTDMNLWVVFVDTFTNPSDAQAWANQTAQRNGLGPNQYLLAVAVGSRQFYLSGDSAGPVSEDALGRIEQQRIQPALASDDWAGAVSAAAAGLQDAAGGGSAGGGILTIVLILVVIAVAVILVVVLVRARRRKQGAAGPAPQRLDPKELARRAGAALVQTDDAVRTSEQELGFARAQFGDDATTEFAAALAQAKTDLDEAFALKQQLDDAVADTPAQRDEWNTRIIDLCAHAGAGLDEKAAAFDELRKLEQNAPEALARVQQLRQDAAGRRDAAAGRLEQLRAAYAPEALTAVADNIDQAQQRLQFADGQLAAAQQAIAAGDGGQAAVAIRAAEQAADQARQLAQAIDTLGTDLAEAQKQATALLQELDGDIATASTLPDPDGTVARVVAATRAEVDKARAAPAGGRTHPLATLSALQAVDTQIDRVVQTVRDAQERSQRAAQMLAQTMMRAQAQVSAAEDYITSRRGAVGADARTRLAQAGAELVQAQQTPVTDPDTALAHAQRADQLAGLALQAAQNDVGGFGGPGPVGRSGGDMVGAVLGGILINSLLGGGRGGGFGGSGGGGVGRSGGGGFSPGSFGGGATRSRRGGGRF